MVFFNADLKKKREDEQKKAAADKAAKAGKSAKAPPKASSERKEFKYTAVTNRLNAEAREIIEDLGFAVDNDQKSNSSYMSVKAAEVVAKIKKLIEIIDHIDSEEEKIYIILNLYYAGFYHGVHTAGGTVGDPVEASKESVEEDDDDDLDDLLDDDDDDD